MGFILAVDDDPAILDLVSRMLGLKGHSVLQASNGQEALDRMEDQEVDLILTDIQMPIMDGYAFFAEARARGFQGQFFGMSGNLMINDVSFDGFLPKPFGFNDLVGTIEKGLSKQLAF